MSVIRNPIDGSITTRWYKKDMASGRFLNFHSIHPITQKLSVMQGYIDRVFRLSSECYEIEEGQRIVDGLKMNGYPLKLINAFINKYTTKRLIPPNTDPIEGAKNEVRRLGMTYVKNVSESIARCFRKYSDSIAFAFKNTSNVYSVYSKLKDKLDDDCKSNVIYEVSCGACGKIYIGMTTQMKKQRMSGHKSDCNRKRMTCALAQHAIEMNHIFDLDNSRIVAQNNSYTKLQTLEKLYIKDARNCVNKKCIEAADVSPIYTHLFKFYQPQ